MADALVLPQDTVNYPATSGDEFQPAEGQLPVPPPEGGLDESGGGTSWRTWALVGGIVVVVLIAAYLIISGKAGQAPSATSSASPAPKRQAAKRITNITYIMNRPGMPPVPNGPTPPPTHNPSPSPNPPTNTPCPSGYTRNSSGGCSPVDTGPAQPKTTTSSGSGITKAIYGPPSTTNPGSGSTTSSANNPFSGYSRLTVVRQHYGVPQYVNTRGQNGFFYAGMNNGVPQVAKYSTTGQFLGVYSSPGLNPNSIGSLAGGTYKTAGQYQLG